eukprot:SAG31_NODE_379_length_16485_cov_3.654583_12_plen_215_part_00
MDLLLITRLVQQRGLATGLNVLDGQTDLKGAFDTVSHKAMDAAIAEAGASDKTRNMFRLLYRSMTAKVRSRASNGDMALSEAYELNRGGAQGSVLMPLMFILTMHYLDKRHDPARAHIHGPGERTPPASATECALCMKTYVPFDHLRETGHCRPCQLARGAVMARRRPHGPEADPEPAEQNDHMTTPLTIAKCHNIIFIFIKARSKPKIIKAVI